MSPKRGLSATQVRLGRALAYLAIGLALVAGLGQLWQGSLHGLAGPLPVVVMSVVLLHRLRREAAR